MEGFKKELADLLRKLNVQIISKSNINDKDFSVEIGFQSNGSNEWTGRHHLGGYDIDGTQRK